MTDWVEFADRPQAWKAARDMDGNSVIVDVETGIEILLVVAEVEEPHRDEIAVAATIAFNNVLFEARGVRYFRGMYETEAGIHSMELALKDEEIADLKAEVEILKGQIDGKLS